jgi:hypothetical protein
MKKTRSGTAFFIYKLLGYFLSIFIREMASNLTTIPSFEMKFSKSGFRSPLFEIRL